jgi:hypothetical protein
MTILVDTLDEEPIDLNQGVKSTQEPQDKQATDKVDTIPEKFKGKTAEEIAASYTALESEIGRMRNELGDYRSMTDRFLSLEEKRVADLGKAGAEDFEIDPTDLLANPEKVLDEYYEHRRGSDPAYTELQSRLDRLEGTLGQSTLQQHHADAVEITSDPKFQTWLGANPYRANIAQQAIQNQDASALDYLLTEWKERQGTQSPAESTQQPSETEAARSVATESSSSGNASETTQERFSRRKLVQLKMRNPEEYSAMSERILLAYAQGRVDD